MLDNPHALDDFRSTFAHQAVITGDIGLALRSVDYEYMGPPDSSRDFLVRREPGPAHSGDACIMDYGEQLLRALCPEIRNRKICIRKKGKEFFIRTNLCSVFRQLSDRNAFWISHLPVTVIHSIDFILDIGCFAMFFIDEFPV